MELPVLLRTSKELRKLFDQRSGFPTGGRAMRNQKATSSKAEFWLGLLF